MRELVVLKDPQQVSRLTAYLAVEAIPVTAEEGDGEWVIWVQHDDDRMKAKEILADFQRDPLGQKFEKAERKMRNVLLEAARLAKEKTRQKDLVEKRQSRSWWHCFPATYIMMGICFAVVVLGTDWRGLELGVMGPVLCNRNDSKLLDKMNVQTPIIVKNVDGVEERRVYVVPDFPKDNLTPGVILAVLSQKGAILGKNLELTISSGEVWRFVTPAFLHFGVLHIVFNMMWLRALGTAIEYVRGTRSFVILCLTLAVTSNIVQLYWSGPSFGGMSGVVFGLIGYLWMMGKTQPRAGLAMPQQTFVFSVAWLVLCMAGAFGPIANGAHLGGFVVGIVIAGRKAIWKRLTFSK